MAVSRFPTDSRYASLYSGDIAGRFVNSFQQLPDQYPGVIVKPMMIGATRGADSTARIRTWVLHLKGLSRVEAKQYDDHVAEAKDGLLPFEFRQWRTGMDDSGILYSGAHYAGYEKPEPSHIDSQERIITIVKEGLA